MTLKKMSVIISILFVILVALITSAYYDEIKMREKRYEDEKRRICLYSFKLGYMIRQSGCTKITREDIDFLQEMEKMKIDGYITPTILNNIDFDQNGFMIFKVR